MTGRGTTRRVTKRLLVSSKVHGMDRDAVPSLFDLTDGVPIVTGGSRGIGLGKPLKPNTHPLRDDLAAWQGSLVTSLLVPPDIANHAPTTEQLS